MSGLLDKATKSTKVKAKEVSQEALLIDDNSAEGDEINKNILIAMQVGGVITLLASMFLLVLVGWIYATWVDYAIAISVLLVGWAMYNGSDYLSTGLSNMKMAITAFAFAGLFIVTIVGTVFMNAGGGVSIASIEFDGDKDEIDLSFIGPRGMDYTIEVLVNGTVAYSHDAEINIDRGSHSISLDEFWAGNAMDMSDHSEVSYEIKVTSEGGNDSFTFDGIMNREVDTSFVKVTERFHTDADTGNKEYTGIIVEMIIGMGDPDAVYDFYNTIFTGVAPKPIASDWTAILEVKSANGGEAYTYNSLNANEGSVTGLKHNGAEESYIGEFYFDWVVLPGTAETPSIFDPYRGDQLARDDFYGGDECYTFEVSITNALGDSYIDSSSKIEFFWDANEANSDDTPAEAC
jgi:hypothetical protein